MKFVVCLTMIANLSNKVLNEQDKKSALQQQVIELQAQIAHLNNAEAQKQHRKASGAYLNAALKGAATRISAGKQFPITSMPINAKHSPSEKVLIFRAAEKGVQMTRVEQDNFRKEIRKAIRDELMKQVEVIKPTRFGGNIVIFASEGIRNMAYNKLRANEEKGTIFLDKSCLLAPKKQYAKAICRQLPTDISPKDFLNDIYFKFNPQLTLIQENKRETKIFEMKALGWIFELGSLEAAAIYAQNGRVRYSFGGEVKIDGFISLQQCYKCCMFGHNAQECMSEVEYCRLCGKSGHTGRDCGDRDNRAVWKCANCMITSEQNGYKLFVDHAAAQLHRCPCAQEQLAAMRIFTSPFYEETAIQQQERQMNVGKESQASGLQINNEGGKKKNQNVSKERKPRSQSKNNGDVKGQDKNKFGNKDGQDTQSTISTSQTTVNQSNNKLKPMADGAGIKYQRSTAGSTRPRSIEGWKVVSKYEGWNVFGNNDNERGRTSNIRAGGTNSTSNLPIMMDDNLALNSEALIS